MEETEAERYYQQYRPLLAKKSRQVWQKLPPRTRAWIDLDDLMQMGAIHLQTEVVPKWDPAKGSFLVWAWILLDRFYTNELIRLTAKKRDDYGTSNVDDAAIKCRLGRHSEVTQKLQVRQGLARVYQDASPGLQKSLRGWLKGNRRLDRRGLRFRMVRAELLGLVKQHRVTVDDVRYALKWS